MSASSGTGRALTLAVLTALVLTGVAIGGAGARPTATPPPLPALAIPAGWQPQPTLVAAADQASSAAAGARARSIAAWGEPVLGCFATAVVVGLASGDEATTVLAELRTALAAGATVLAWTADAGVVTASFARAGWRGELRGQVTGRNPARATVVACFHNDRAPARCQSACGALLASLPVTNLRNP